MRTRGKRWRHWAAAAFIAGALTPVVLRWVRRTGSTRRAVNMRMTVVVERPVAEVFAFCHDFENFPKLLHGLVTVSDTQDGRSRWTVRAPTGRVIEWDATVTKYVPNNVIAWQSVPGSPVEAGGLMRFAPLSPNETRVDMQLTYLPRHTGLADAFSALMAGGNEKRLRATLARAPETVAAETDSARLAR